MIPEEMSVVESERLARSDSTSSRFRSQTLVVNRVMENSPT